MAYCGGLKIDGTTLKLIEGVICEANTLLIDPDSVVTACGNQLWDGDSFKVVKVNGKPVITHVTNGEAEIEGTIKMNAPCGVGVDKRFFEIDSNGALALKAGFLLEVLVTPADAQIDILDTEAHAIQPIAGTTNQFLCPSGNVSVTVQKEGYEGKSQTVNMNGNKVVEVELEEG